MKGFNKCKDYDKYNDPIGYVRILFGDESYI